MTSLYSEQRKIEKAGHGKLLPVKYSPEIFIVEQVIKPKKNKDFAHPEYILKHLNGTIVKTEEKKTDKIGLVREARRFFATDLIHTEKEQQKVLSQHQGIKLNKLAVDAFNQEELEEIEKKKEIAREKTKTKRVTNKEREEKEREEYIENPRKSGRSNKGQSGKIYVDFEMNS
jgi:endo-1,4-beta-D-glucanase Y